MDPSQDSLDMVAYMNMLNRNIPGVGNNPLTSATTTTTTTAPPPAKPTTTTTTHLTNKTTTLPTKPLTQNQRHAIDTLNAALKDALYVSEGEEPFQTVHITIGTGPGAGTASPQPSAAATATTATATATAPSTTTTSFPSEADFVTLLETAQLLTPSSSFSLQQAEDDDAKTCEKSSDLQSILNKSNPGSDKIAQALHDIFGYPSSPSPSPIAATTTVVNPDSNKKKNDKIMLYRVADPSSSTKVHIWVLGWIDGDLVGVHTISIES
ncbi:hypothetical protein BGX23_007551 [Mortierella sp. AD031]|nr:hypothetical protein BGX23_007551 [Mortierella sp. AD031]KAG0219112.1 hypothetical protein BGX33_004682 [Mortierella sp. NVP41]